MTPRPTPGRPAAAPIPDGIRTLRQRTRDVRDAIARDRRAGPSRSARELVRIIDGGNMPSGPDRVYWANPVEIDADDAEGATPTFAADADQVVPVVVVRGSPRAGDLLVAHSAAGRWVAEKGGGPTTICVGGCSPRVPVYGATIDLLSGGEVVASCTTGADGCCAFTQTGPFTVRVTISGSIAYSATRTLSGAPIAIPVPSGSGLVCCGGYAIPTSLTLTDGAGSIAFLYDPDYYYPVWAGGHSVQRSSCTVSTANNLCLVADPSHGPVRVCYQMICHAGQTPTFSVQRSWSWVYMQGTLTPAWYQDDTGFAPGQLCITAPPTACGNPLTDTANFGTDPSSTTPFALSGTPVPAVSNATPDPIGGTVAISS